MKNVIPYLLDLRSQFLNHLNQAFLAFGQIRNKFPSVKVHSILPWLPVSLVFWSHLAHQYKLQIFLEVEHIPQCPCCKLVESFVDMRVH